MQAQAMQAQAIDWHARNAAPGSGRGTQVPARLPGLMLYNRPAASTASSTRFGSMVHLTRPSG